MKHSQSGSALIYAILAIALLGILTLSLSKGGNEQGSQKKQTQLISELSGQIDFITSAIQECVINYPTQDAALTSADQKNPPYPLFPNQAYFSTSTPGPAAAHLVEFIRCPGNPGGAGPNSKNHARIFTSSAGKFMPQPAPLFGPWWYYNYVDGVFFYVCTNKTDPYLTTALKKLESKYSACEVDYLDGRSGAFNMSTDGFQVLNSEQCFRYWIVRKPTAIPAEIGCN